MTVYGNKTNNKKMGLTIRNVQLNVRPSWHNNNSLFGRNYSLVWFEMFSVQNNKMKAKLTINSKECAEKLNHTFYHMFYAVVLVMESYVEQVFPEEQFSYCLQIALEFLHIWQRYLCREVVLLHLLNPQEQTWRTFTFQDDNVSNKNWCLGGSS